MLSLGGNINNNGARKYDNVLAQYGKISDSNPTMLNTGDGHNNVANNTAMEEIDDAWLDNRNGESNTTCCSSTTSEPMVIILCGLSF